jgi:Domain of unknown function (DUF4268)
MIGKLQRVKLRKVWKHEAHDFTTWLEENIDVLNEALGISVESVEREKAAGAFNVDLVGEDNSGNIVVIENQLGRSDHDHLGKLITYLTFFEAKTAIWIVSEPRPEHVKAVAWLNEGGTAGFYLVKLEAIKIEDSLPAPLLTLITGPSKETVEAGKTKKELAARHVARLAFWTALLARAKKKTKLHAAISPGQRNYVATSAGLPYGLNLNYSVRRHDAQAELYIDADRDTGEGNKAIFDKLISQQDTIEQDFGGPLKWDSLESSRGCRISKVVSIAGWQDEEKWPEAHEALVDAMISLEHALRPHLKKIKKSGK